MFQHVDIQPIAPLLALLLFYLKIIPLQIIGIQLSGFFICGEFINFEGTNRPHPPNGSSFSFENGLTHIAPIPSSSQALTLGELGTSSGFNISDTELSFAQTSYLETDGCNGQPATLSVVRWQLDGANSIQLGSPEVFTNNLHNIQLKENFEAYTIALLPAGSPAPPIPLSALKLLDLPGVQAGINIPTAEELGLVPARPAPPAAGSTITETPIPCPAKNEIRRVTQFPSIPISPNCIDASKKYTATFKTSEGDIKVVLDTQSINATNAFILLARYHYYDGSALFRTDPRQAIIQGGAVHSNRVDDIGPGFSIPDDNRDFIYGAGELIMARNATPNSGNGQFIFTVNDRARALSSNTTSPNFVVFGVVTEGLDILRRILSLHVDDPTATEVSKFFLGGPIRPIIVEGIVITEE